MAYNELLESATGAVRPQWASLSQLFQLLSESATAQAGQRLSAMIANEGMSYGQEANAVEQSWVLDSVPLVISTMEWEKLETGLLQRAKLFDALLTDFYGEQLSLKSGIVAPELIYGHAHYLRKAARLKSGGPHELFMHACDIGRAPNGEFLVFGDRTQAPSGLGYALADRKVLSQTFPAFLRKNSPQRLSGFVGTLRLALAQYAPAGVTEPVIAVLSPGSYSETAFDQAYLATSLGFPLVEAADLVVREGSVFMRSMGQLNKIDVILRRVDADYVDPLDLQSSSRLGVVGLVEAISRGSVSVVNTIGSGVLENPALQAFLPDLSRLLLGEELLLNSVPSWWAGNELGFAEIVNSLDTKVVYNIQTNEVIDGYALDSTAKSELIDRITVNPWPWSARALIEFSMAPSLLDDGGRPASKISAKPVGLRTFCVSEGTGYRVLTGGLGYVLAPGAAGSSMKTIGAKDVWVPFGENSDIRQVETTINSPAFSVLGVGVHGVVSPRVLADLYWFGRYGERAEQTTRMLAVVRERYEEYLQRPWLNGQGAVPVLLRSVLEITETISLSEKLSSEMVVAVEASQLVPMNVEKLIATLTYNRQLPGSVAFAINQLSTAARSVRDQMSTSTWMVLSGLEQNLRQFATDPKAKDENTFDEEGHLAVAHSEILRGLLALTGLQAESMVHDPGWLFMDIGVRLERALNIIEFGSKTLLNVRQNDELDTHRALLDSFLVVCESSVIYRRRNPGILQLAAVLSLLVFDDSNPRSLSYQLLGIQRNFQQLPEDLRLPAAERLVAEVVVELRRSAPLNDVAQQVEFGELFSQIGIKLRELNDILTATRFTKPAELQPIWGMEIEGDLQ